MEIVLTTAIAKKIFPLPLSAHFACSGGIGFSIEGDNGTWFNVEWNEDKKMFELYTCDDTWYCISLPHIQTVSQLQSFYLSLTGKELIITKDMFDEN